MALNDIFMIQYINLENRDFSYYVKAKELEEYWNQDYANHSNKKIITDYFLLNTIIF